MRRGLSRFEEIFNECIDIILFGSKGRLVYVFSSIRACRECSIIEGSKGDSKTNLLLSKTLVEADTRYLPLEKLALALVHAIRKLPHYFQAHTMYVLTEYPLQSLLKRSDFKMLRDDVGSSKCCLDLWLSSMFDCIHVCVFLLFEKLFLSNLDSFSIPLDS